MSRKDERYARWVRRRSHQEDLDSTDDVHGRSDARAQVEEYADGAAELGTERARDEEVRAAARNHAVRRDRAHADRRRERLQQQQKYKRHRSMLHGGLDVHMSVFDK